MPCGKNIELNLRVSFSVVAKLSVAVINTKETTDCICVKCLRGCLSPAWVKFLPLWVSSSFIFQYKWAAFSSTVLRRSTFDVFWDLFNLVRFYAQLLTSLCSHPFPFFPFVELSIFLLNFLIFSAIARPTRSCDDVSKWYPVGAGCHFESNRTPFSET